MRHRLAAENERAFIQVVIATAAPWNARQLFRLAPEGSETVATTLIVSPVLLQWGNTSRDIRRWV
jgi:hypothetical protein